MGIGYAVSPPHRIAVIDAAAIPREADAALLFPIPPGSRALPWNEIAKHLRSPTVAAITQWRAGLSAKYRSQLHEPLCWDEDSVFEESEDVPTRADMLLRHAGALVDRLGAVAAAAALRGREDIPRAEIETEAAAAERRGFVGAFPQLLLGAAFWFPFRRDLIIEEPDWSGNLRRFGSAAHLVRELEVLRDFIGRADAAATAWGRDRDDPPTVLGQAWQGSETIYRLVATATRRRLPLWTTG